MTATTQGDDDSYNTGPGAIPITQWDNDSYNTVGR